MNSSSPRFAPRHRPAPWALWCAAILFSLSLFGDCAPVKATEPLTQDDVVTPYSDTMSIDFRVPKAAVVLNPANPSSAGCHTHASTDVRCLASVSRFCQGKGLLSGFGFENGQDASLLDITCLTQRAAAIVTVYNGLPGALPSPFCDYPVRDTRDPTVCDDCSCLPIEQQPASCQFPNGTSCSSMDTSATCGTGIKRHCQDLGYGDGFGPIEQGQCKSDVVCIEAEAVELAPGAPLVTGEVEALVTGCQFSNAPTSPECRQAMSQVCEQASEIDALRGGYGPRERSGDQLYFGCVRQSLPWTANSQLPEEPSLPIDIIGREINSGTGTLAADFEHNRLAPNRSLSFDGRLYLRFYPQSTADPDNWLGFLVQAPESFTEPLSQEQAVDSSLADPAQAFRVNEEDGDGNTIFYDAEAYDGGVIWNGNSSAICDPYANAQAPPASNRQQSVPGRRSNPFACSLSDEVGDPQSALQDRDHDCYDVTILTTVVRDDIEDVVEQHQLWGTEVRVMVANPKRAGSERSKVVAVHPQGSPVAADLDSLPPGDFFPLSQIEPTVTGDGRLLLVNAGNTIRYSVNSTGDPCDVTRWTDFKPLYEMHYDPEMVGYGLATFPMRDVDGTVLDSASFDGESVPGAYPWVDRDGDNLMYMQVRSTLYYLDDDGVARAKLDVLGHPYCGPNPTAPSCVAAGTGTPNPNIYLHPQNEAQVRRSVDVLPRVGLTFMGLWTQGKMFIPDSRNNAADIAIGEGPANHRDLALYEDGDGDPATRLETEIGTTIRTAINSIENQFNLRQELLPDTAREVVWHVSTQGQTDEIVFDDAIDPDALIVSNMTASIYTNTLAGDAGRRRFADGFVHRGLLRGSGFASAPRVANFSSSLSEEAIGGVNTTLHTAGQLRWNAPAHGRLLGGGRIEPIAAGGFHGKGLWLDGADDRLEYEVPQQPTDTAGQMANATWFYHLSFDPRDLDSSRRLLTAPDGTWLEIVDHETLRFGKNLTSHTIALPDGSELHPRTWSSIGIVSRDTDVEIFYDGFPLASEAGAFFRMQPGLFSVGAASGGFRGWIDDLTVIGRELGPEEICNHARGTLIGLDAQTGAAAQAKAAAYPAASHTRIESALLAAEYGGPLFGLYLCERPISDPEDAQDLADHDHYACLGQTRRTTSPSCLRNAFLNPNFQLDWQAPRPDEAQNAFCTSCHVDGHPSRTMTATDALSASLTMIPMHEDIRRQPLQSSPRIFGVLPPDYFGPGSPASDHATGLDGCILDALLSGAPINAQTCP